MFHPLHTDIAPPERFTFPFCYEPHRLCVMAAEKVQQFVAAKRTLREDADRGKMFGVLVAEDGRGQKGFLAAYSGLLAGRNDWEFFVPPVYDSQQADGYFKRREAEISAVSGEIRAMEALPEYAAAMERKRVCEEGMARALAEWSARMKAAKAERDRRRKEGFVSAAEAAEMIRESQFMKAELRRMKGRWGDELEAAGAALTVFTSRIEEKKRLRKDMSDRLQRWLFDRYEMLNAKGERRSLCSIFAGTAQGVPPSGAGDCCAPKLLQYAYLHGLRPLCMAEFWWGESPKTEIRHHLHYYPACQGKCKPILSHMLVGVEVDDDPRAAGCEDGLEIVYEDSWIAVVCKPSGMLSVPGKGQCRSVLSEIKERCAGIEGPVIVHRLDMYTSGLLVVAKTKEAHEGLQRQFLEHKVRKRYVALLEGCVALGCKGVVSLPLAPDYMDRPRQCVDSVGGKEAVTEYEVVGCVGGRARVVLRPLTGRTHQLRVHCAHPDGLGSPILGDSLYGREVAERLFLHAEAICFEHPVTGQKLGFERAAGF